MMETSCYFPSLPPEIFLFFQYDFLGNFTLLAHSLLWEEGMVARDQGILLTGVKRSPTTTQVPITTAGK